MAELLFLVNDLETLDPLQSTAELIAEVEAQGHAAWVCGVAGMAGSPDGPVCLARRWPGGRAGTDSVERLRGTGAVERAITDFAGLWVRTNPGRMMSGSLGWLQLLLQAEDHGLPVRNAPVGLLRAASKTYLGSLPADTVPPTWYGDDPDWLAECLRRLGGPAVVKPASGTRGSGVVRVAPGMPDLDAIFAEAVREGSAVLQGYLDEAPDGDVRIHLIDGALFEVDGRACAVRRVPADGEWRSNVALGGRPVPAALSERQREVAGRVGAVVAAHGLWHVGLDVVGDRVVECNVFSPGGLRDASRFAEAPFTAVLVERFVASLS